MPFHLLTCRDVPDGSVFSRMDEEHMEVGSWQKGDYKPALLISPPTVVRACVKGTEDTVVPRTGV